VLNRSTNLVEAVPMLFAVSCDTTGRLDASSAIQAQIDAAKNAGGGRVLLPAGTLLVNSGLVVDSGVIVEGQGWEEYKGHFGEYEATRGERGTYLKQTTNSSSVFALANTATGAVIRNLAIYQSHPADTSGWIPNTYPVCFNCEGPNGGQVTIENILFWGVFRGIDIGATGGSVTGRVHINNCYGEFYDYAINGAFAADVVRISDFHAYSSYLVGQPNKEAYMFENAIALRIGRLDNPMITRFFAIGYKRGVNVVTTIDGPCYRIQLSDSGFDACHVGIEFGADSTSALISNTYISGSANSGQALIVAGNNVTLMWTNAYLANVRAHGVAVVDDVSGCDVSFSTLWVENWNQVGGNYPALYASSGNTITVGGRLRATGGEGGGITAGAGTFNVSHAN
jgi:hypothetical protein